MPVLLQINVTSNWGSTGKIAEQIGHLAQERGWKSYIMYGRYANTSSSQTIRIGSIVDYGLHYLFARLLDKQGLFSARATRKALKEIERIKPDIIHLHNIHGYYLNYPILFKFLSKKRIPVIWTLHDCWPFTGHCAFFEKIECAKWRQGCHSCELTREYPKSWFVDNSIQNYSLKNRFFNKIPSENMLLVPVSEWLSSLVGNSFLRGFKRSVIHNGVDTDTFMPQKNGMREKLNLNEKDFVVLGVSSVWDVRKGMLDFMALSKRSEVKVVLVGVSEKEERQLPSNIIAVRRTQNQKELSMIYSMADVYVNPTYDDNFPTTNIEALACGTPVITYRTGGSPEAVDSETGIVVNKGDINGLAEAINEIKQKGKAFYSDACRRRAMNCFKSPDCYMDYLRLYNELIK